MKYNDLFNKEKPVLGMIHLTHLSPLPARNPGCAGSLRITPEVPVYYRFSL